MVLVGCSSTVDHCKHQTGNTEASLGCLLVAAVVLVVAVSVAAVSVAVAVLALALALAAAATAASESELVQPPPSLTHCCLL
jgi:hypothetical protein